MFLVFSCSSEKPATTAAKGPLDAGNAAPGVLRQAGPSQYALELVPKEPTRKSTVSLRPTGFDLAGAKIEWLLNGRPITTLVPTQFNGADGEKGSTLQARATIQGREVWSDVVQIRNAPPEITRVTLLPEIFKPGDALSIEVEGADPDGDPVIILYEWTRNGAPAGRGTALEVPVRRGDDITISVIPNDGEASGSPAVLARKIENMPPMFVEHKNYSFDGKRYMYRARAADPDGDTVAYALLSPPTDMSIDRFTGELVWTVPPDFKGQQPVTIRADDGHGGTAEYTVVFSLTEQPQTGQ